MRDIVFGSESGFRLSGFYRGENGCGDGDVEGDRLVVGEKILEAVDGGLGGVNCGDGGDGNLDDGKTEA